MVDYRIYNTNFDDVKIREYVDNLITENIYAEFHEEGWEQLMTGEIVEHHSDEYASRKEYSFIDKG